MVAVVPPPAPARSSGCWSRRTHLATRSTCSFVPPLEPMLLRAVIVPHRNSRSTGAREIRCVGELPHQRIQAPPAPASSPIGDSKLLQCRTAPLLMVAAPPRRPLAPPSPHHHARHRLTPLSPHHPACHRLAGPASLRRRRGPAEARARSLGLELGHVGTGAAAA
jgi:hypothetical protein